MLIALFCAIFGAVYELFGHNVYSYRMIYAFLAPLVLGAICLFALALRAKWLPGSWPLIYYIAAAALLFTGLILYLRDGRHHPAPADAD